MIPDVQFEMQQSQQALSSALQQVSTGLRVNQLSDDPNASAAMVTSLATSANVDQYTKNVNALQSQMQTVDSALSAVVTSLNSAITAGTSGANGTNSSANKAAILTQVQGILSNVIAQANTSYQGVYVFGGSASTTPPFVNAATSFVSTQGSVGSLSTPLTAGSTTTISDAGTGGEFVFKAKAGDTVSTLATAMAAAVTAGTLSAGANISVSGAVTVSNTNNVGIAVSTTDPVFGSMTATSGTEIQDSYLYVGNSTVNSAKVGDSLSVKTNLPGDQVFTSGADVIGSLTGLISALKSGTTTQIGTATTAVNTALNYLSAQRVPFDNTISQLNAQESFLGQETVTLSSQQTALVGISLADAATNLSQAQQTNSAVLAAAAKSIPMTLLDYLK